MYVVVPLRPVRVRAPVLFPVHRELAAQHPSHDKGPKADIDKMHAYRDAIRDPYGRRVVAYAGVLYPGPYVRYSPGLEAIGADPEKREALDSRLGATLETFLSSVDRDPYGPDRDGRVGTSMGLQGLFVEGSGDKTAQW